ncbi:MAG: hypothetical protein ACREU7_15895, partial [Burkholderiales bacterium]
ARSGALKFNDASDFRAAAAHLSDEVAVLNELADEYAPAAEEAARLAAESRQVSGPMMASLKKSMSYDAYRARRSRMMNDS